MTSRPCSRSRKSPESKISTFLQCHDFCFFLLPKDTRHQWRKGRSGYTLLPYLLSPIPYPLSPHLSAQYPRGGGREELWFLDLRRILAMILVNKSRDWPTHSLVSTTNHTKGSFLRICKKGHMLELSAWLHNCTLLSSINADFPIFLHIIRKN